MIRKANEIDQMYTVVNSVIKGMQFVTEQEREREIGFLDVLIVKKSNR